MRVWVVSPTAVAFHFNPTCRKGLFTRNLMDIEITRDQVRWEWDVHRREWWPSHVEVTINGKVRRLGPCTICCPVEGPRDSLRYGDCMAWLVRQLGAVPPQAT